MNILDRDEFFVSEHGRKDLALLRWALVIVFLWFGALMSAATYLITPTFLVTIPGVAEPNAGGFPAISAVPGQFLLKDAVLLAASLVLLLASIRCRNTLAST
ncbi:DUF417 family protein [Sphingomonas sp. CFBP 13728]|uniref:DUF417 family protein n=1 Tax=Sphingomonas sp. CFBP 13728 TaxID=2775294 RepID=UPI00177A76F9|nr:DUF417 family protein [Sphingomonas sp. CFBP 13728]MBD8620943.1 DUF417 family protein [Sphingomonas sp. CFBP 13728]